MNLEFFISSDSLFTGMTPDDYDIENFVEYVPEIEQQDQQQEVTTRNVLPNICTDIFDNQFLNIENAESITNHFEYSQYNADTRVHDKVDQYENNQNEANHQFGEQQIGAPRENEKLSEIETNDNENDDADSDVRARKKRQYICKTRSLKPDEWMVNQRKQKRNSGQGYVSKGGKSVAAKEFINKACNCRMQCDTKFTERERKLLFDMFWDLQDFNLQNISLHGMVKGVEVERHRDPGLLRPRFKTYQYYLQPNEHVDPLRVCKRYFLDTFQISHGRLYRCCSKPDLEGVVDHRGKPGDDKEQRRLQKTHVKEHIEQYGLFKERFLSSTLTISNMYNLYVEECEAQQQLPLSKTYYYQVMDTILSVKLLKDERQLQRRKKKALLKRMYSREELVRMVGAMLRLRRQKELQKKAALDEKNALF